jgi:hypothetical protein
MALLERPSERFVMSDQSIATIARDLAAALLAAGVGTSKPVPSEAGRRRSAETEITALQAELCAEYRAEIVETVRI